MRAFIFLFLFCQVAAAEELSLKISATTAPGKTFVKIFSLICDEADWEKFESWAVKSQITNRNIQIPEHSVRVTENNIHSDNYSLKQEYGRTILKIKNDTVIGNGLCNVLVKKLVPQKKGVVLKLFPSAKAEPLVQENLYDETAVMLLSAVGAVVGFIYTIPTSGYSLGPAVIAATHSIKTAGRIIEFKQLESLLNSKFVLSCSTNEIVIESGVNKVFYRKANPLDKKSKPVLTMRHQTTIDPNVLEDKTFDSGNSYDFVRKLSEKCTNNHDADRLMADFDRAQRVSNQRIISLIGLCTPEKNFSKTSR